MHTYPSNPKCLGLLIPPDRFKLLLSGVKGLMLVRGLSAEAHVPLDVPLDVVMPFGLLLFDLSSATLRCALVILLCAFCNKLLGVCGVSYSLRERSFLWGGVRGNEGNFPGTHLADKESATCSSSESSQLKGIGDSS